MRSSFRIARIMGIDISLDLSWFIIFALMIYNFGFLQFPRELASPAVRFARADLFSVSLGVLASLLLFASVLAHEFSHSWMAIERGIPVSSITLFIFGGVAQIADEPDRPSSEFLIAIMGPLMSAALALVFGAAWIWFQILQDALGFVQVFHPLVLVTGIIAQANGALALFNLAPGFPLDGGRVLRSVLWAALKNVRRATRWASFAGQAIAAAMIAFGAWAFITEFDGSGLWYILIGMFLWSAARQGYQQTALRQALRDVRVGQLMTPLLDPIPPETSISDLILQFALRNRGNTFAVMQGDRLLGIVTMKHVRGIPRSKWATVRVCEVMLPHAILATLHPLDDGSTALARLSRAKVEELPVMEHGKMLGWLGRSDLARFLNLNIGIQDE